MLSLTRVRVKVMINVCQLGLGFRLGSVLVQRWRNDFESEWASPEKVVSRGGGGGIHFFFRTSFFSTFIITGRGVVILHDRPLW